MQACLPLLATYLGHVNISGTQAYLTMTPDLLTEASKCFEHYAAVGKGGREHDNEAAPCRPSCPAVPS